MAACAPPSGPHFVKQFLRLCKAPPETQKSLNDCFRRLICAPRRLPLYWTWADFFIQMKPGWTTLQHSVYRLQLAGRSKQTQLKFPSNSAGLRQNLLACFPNYHIARVPFPLRTNQKYFKRFINDRHQSLTLQGLIKAETREIRASPHETNLLLMRKCQPVCSAYCKMKE